MLDAPPLGPQLTSLATWSAQASTTVPLKPGVPAAGVWNVIVSEVLLSPEYSPEVVSPVTPVMVAPHIANCCPESCPEAFGGLGAVASFGSIGILKRLA